jgi:hypothetical protein
MIYELTEDQQAAKTKILQAVSKRQKLIALKGYAGTGKSVVVTSLVKDLEAIGYVSYICATTHKAASVLSSRGLEATTVHSKFFRTVQVYSLPGEENQVGEALAIQWVRKNKKMAEYPDIVSLLSNAMNEFKADKINNLPEAVLRAIDEDFIKQALSQLNPQLVSDLSRSRIDKLMETLGTKRAVLIVDEASMLETDAAELLDNLPTEFQALTSIIFVGDDFQLPPIKSCQMKDGKLSTFFVDMKADAVLTEVKRIQKTDHYGPLHFATAMRTKYKTSETVMNRFGEQSNFLPPQGLNVKPNMANHSATIITYTNIDRVMLNNDTRVVLHGEKYQVWPLPGDRIIAETNSTCNKYTKGSVYSVISFDPETCVIEVVDLVTHESSKLYFSGAKAYLSFSKVMRYVGHREKFISDSKDYFNKIKTAESRAKDRLSKARSKAKYELTVESEKFKLSLQENGAAQKTDRLLAAEKARIESENAWLKANEMPSVSFDFAFALTCHKSQGSEFRTVIVLDQESRDSRWIYTACTRTTQTLYWCRNVAEVQKLLGIKPTPCIDDGWP